MLTHYCLESSLLIKPNLLSYYFPLNSRKTTYETVSDQKKKFFIFKSIMVPPPPNPNRRTGELKIGSLMLVKKAHICTILYFPSFD